MIVIYHHHSPSISAIEVAKIQHITAAIPDFLNSIPPIDQYRFEPLPFHLHVCFQEVEKATTVQECLLDLNKLQSELSGARLLAFVPAHSPVAACLMQMNPKAKWGAWIPDFDIAFCYHFTRENACHELSHLLGADDCYGQLGEPLQECDNPNCIMRYGLVVDASTLNADRNLCTRNRNRMHDELIPVSTATSIEFVAARVGACHRRPPLKPNWNDEGSIGTYLLKKGEIYKQNYKKAKNTDDEFLSTIDSNIYSKAWKSLKDFYYRGRKFDSWLSTVNRSACADFFREKKRQARLISANDAVAALAQDAFPDEAELICHDEVSNQRLGMGLSTHDWQIICGNGDARYAGMQNAADPFPNLDRVVFLANSPVLRDFMNDEQRTTLESWCLSLGATWDALVNAASSKQRWKKLNELNPALESELVGLQTTIHRKSGWMLHLEAFWNDYRFIGGISPFTREQARRNNRIIDSLNQVSTDTLEQMLLLISTDTWVYLPDRQAWENITDGLAYDNAIPILHLFKRKKRSRGLNRIDDDLCCKRLSQGKVRVRSQRKNELGLAAAAHQEYLSGDEILTLWRSLDSKREDFLKRCAQTRKELGRHD